MDSRRNGQSCRINIFSINHELLCILLNGKRLNVPQIMRYKYYEIVQPKSVIEDAMNDSIQFCTETGVKPHAFNNEKLELDGPVIKTVVALICPSCR